MVEKVAEEDFIELADYYQLYPIVVLSSLVLLVVLEQIMQAILL
jgi:hypothetical protein